MAQVYLAIQEGIGGFEKPVVVKRIFPHLCESEQFVKMFLDEARLAATVRHPNVVEIFDIGHDDDGYFIVMEYLSGETVAFLAQTLSRRESAVPPRIACRIGAAVAAGLHHAHQAVDATGRPQPLVHRDITPSNLILCYNGAVKILDFGIAKAIESADESSDSSAVKGKLSYLAPEQVRNQPVDARTDVFQLGIVMHEMLCGRRLFNARTNHEKISAVLERPIPRPSSINPEIPGFLDDVVLAALERDRDERLGSADQLRHLLENAAKQLGEPMSDHDLGAWLREAFPKAHAERLEIERFAITAARTSPKVLATASPASAPPAGEVQETGESFESDALTPAGHGQKLSGAEVEESSLSALLAFHAAETDDPDAEQPTVAVSLAEITPASSKRSRWPYLLAAATVALVMFGAAGALLVRSRGAATRSGWTPAQSGATGAPERVSADPGEALATYDISLVVVPEDATLVLDGQERAVGALFTTLPRDGSAHAIAIAAPGYAPQTLAFSGDAPPPSVVRLHPLPEPDDAASPRDSPATTRSQDPPRDDAPPRGASPNAPRADVDAAGENAPAPPIEEPHTDNIDPWAK